MDPSTQSTLLIIGAVGAQIGILIAAVFAGMAARDARRIALDTKAETLAQTVKIDTVATKTAVIEGHVNSEKSIMEGEKNTLKRENEMLREWMASATVTAALLAQAASHAAAVVVVPAAASTPAPTTAAEESLAQIDANTKATANNTARTDATVQDLKDNP